MASTVASPPTEPPTTVLPNVVLAMPPEKTAATATSSPTRLPADTLPSAVPTKKPDGATTVGAAATPGEATATAHRPPTGRAVRETVALKPHGRLLGSPLPTGYPEANTSSLCQDAVLAPHPPGAPATTLQSKHLLTPMCGSSMSATGRITPHAGQPLETS